MDGRKAEACALHCNPQQAETTHHSSRTSERENA
jgi:hypothetical protein